jgi:hypothetical protein
MATRLKASVTRRPSLPLTAKDERSLDLIRTTSTYQRALAQLAGDVGEPGTMSEGALLHAVFAAGLQAVRHTAAEAGYAALADQRSASLDARRAESRRRPPAWADEP